MRAPKRRRPLVRRIVAPPPDLDKDAIAAAASYVGSPEHKDTPSFVEEVRPRADASICDRSLATRRAEITDWLREAICKGVVSGYFEGRFPRYVWYKDGDVVYEGRLSNRDQGHYKGYPLEKDDWPRGIETYYGQP